MNRSVVHSFVDAAARFPSRPALWAGGRLYTYAEFGGLAEGVRRVLDLHGIREGHRVGIVTGDDAVTYAAILAIIANGAAYVPINWKNPAARNRVVIEDSGVNALLSSPSRQSVALQAAEGNTRCGLLEINETASATLDPLRVNWTHEPSLAYLLFTSGSTGKPKGVPISHENLNSFMAFMLGSALYDFGPEDRFLQMFELTFDLSVMSVFVPLSMGACCYVVPESRFGAATALKVLQEHQISVALMVPSMLVFLEPYLENRVRLPALRHSLFCGEALPDALVQKWRLAAPNASIENLYGPTEATIFCLRYPWHETRSPPAAVNGIVPIGKPLPGTDAAIMDEQGRLLSAPGAKGELLLMGPQLSDGYWRDPDKTRVAFITVQGPSGEVRAYRTGDICSVDDHGNFIYHGRVDAQVKVDGHRVELGEIEHHVREILGRTNIAVVAATQGKQHLLVLFLEKPEVDLKALVEALRSRVPEYMIPRRLEYIEALPLNLSGKVDRPRLAGLVNAQ